jgi:UDP-N-acetylglucosamine 2-epimerase (non-hydrolysing)
MASTGREHVKIPSVVGARPQFVKLAPADPALRDRGYEHVIAHTSQHHDRLRSQAFFDDLAIEPPAANLGSALVAMPYNPRIPSGPL